jgi:hypothetical protein
MIDDNRLGPTTRLICFHHAGGRRISSSYPSTRPAYPDHRSESAWPRVTLPRTSPPRCPRMQQSLSTNVPRRRSRPVIDLTWSSTDTVIRRSRVVSGNISHTGRHSGHAWRRIGPT